MISGHGWDDERFIERCRKAAARKGWSLSKLCLEAKLANDYLKHQPGRGRNINSIIKLADAADVSVAWLLGLDEASEHLARIGLVANIASHLFVAMHPTAQGTPDMSIDDVALVLVDLFRHPKPSEKAEAEPPLPPVTEPATEEPLARRRSRASRSRSTVL